MTNKETAKKLTKALFDHSSREGGVLRDQIEKEFEQILDQADKDKKPEAKPGMTAVPGYGVMYRVEAYRSYDQDWWLYCCSSDESVSKSIAAAVVRGYIIKQISELEDGQWVPSPEWDEYND